MSNSVNVFVKVTPTGRVKICYTGANHKTSPMVKELLKKGWKREGCFYTSPGYNTVSGSFPTMTDVLKKRKKV